MIANRLEALVVARAHTSTGCASSGELVQPLARFAPTDITEATWRARLAEIADDLRRRGELGDDYRPRDRELLGRYIGRHTARDWRQLADRVLPALGLGLAPDDKHLGRLTGRDEWTAAIMGRTLGLWIDGAPPSLPAVCDALAWRELGIAGKPKRCPPEIRALFVQRELHTDGGPPDRLVRLLAAREVGAPRPELRAIRDALVRTWLTGRTLGRPAGPARPFADDVREVAGTTRDGVFGDRKVFIASVWNELRRQPSWSSLTLEDFKARLVAAHRAGDLALARADLVAAMDPDLVAASETTTDGASFHFIVREAAS